MRLARRDRTWVNAALVVLHDRGHDPQAVVDTARRLTAAGKAPVDAYKAALNAYAQQAPDTEAALSHVIRLVQSSDDRTVQRYDKALTTYIRTGDPDAMAPVAETFMADSVRLAQRDGGDVADVAAALGFDSPAPFMEAAAALPSTPVRPAAADARDRGTRQPETEDAMRAPFQDYAYVSRKSDARLQHDIAIAGPEMRHAFGDMPDRAPLSREAARALAARPGITILPDDPDGWE